MFRSNPFRTLTFLLALIGAAVAQAQTRQISPPPIVDHNIGRQFPSVWKEDQPLERFLSAVAQRSWIKLEYLHWELLDAGPEGIGAPVSDIGDLITPFQVFNNLNGGVSAGQAIIPNKENLGIEDTPGIRGTLGVALNGAAVELSIFGTDQNGGDLNYQNLQVGRPAGAAGIGTDIMPNVITPLLTNGAVTTSAALNSFVYDSNFSASLHAQMWGAEAIVLQDHYLPGFGPSWQWLGGFRYVSFDEDLRHVGVFNDGGTVPNVIARISGNTVNNIYGPEIGGRASLRTKRVTMSFTPRIAFAINDHTSHVSSGPLTEANEPSTLLIDESVDFTPIFEMNFQLQIHLNTHLSLFGGYDFLYIWWMSRPDENIVYNSIPGLGGAFTPDIRQRVSLDEFLAHGLNLGAMFTY